MSRRSTADYVKVLQAVGRMLKGQCVGEGFVVDYEQALWKAVRYVFEGADIRGCAFHWGQAVWKHVVNLGLSTQYTQDVGTYCYIRKLLRLPFLPPEHIQPTFYALCDLNSADHLKPLLKYIHHTWLQSSTWPVTSWSVYGQSVRNNNDVEGWHRKISGRAGPSPAFHLLVHVLHQESRQMANLVQLVSEMKLRRIHRKSTRAVQAKVFELWDRYTNENLSTTRLLKEMSLVYRHPITS
ncbi:uncharacterized protein LOC123556675 isoform X4 [Mercenaria mercenaria]|uniref:uncharacterized protein LOC123556675 isoform X4 n=1 Tax=Mercenaria mercenaria TaxID=6596 RepID=UPI00234EF61E|nr:uncharacterized protein LOC123556675 isoform X4 [Mercenaria mercenaria]